MIAAGGQRVAGLRRRFGGRFRIRSYPLDLFGFFGIVIGGRAVFSNHAQLRSSARPMEGLSFNDNELEGDLPTIAELLYLRRGLTQAGGKLPLFDLDGQDVDPAVVRRCVARGWSEAWFTNPLKPDWLVCKLTEAGRRIAAAP